MFKRAKKRSKNTKKVKPLTKKEGALFRDKIEVVDFVSTYRFSVRLLVIYLLVMGGVQVIVVFKEVLFIIMNILA